MDGVGGEDQETLRTSVFYKTPIWRLNHGTKLRHIVVTPADFVLYFDRNSTIGRN